jgi:hypothetical protein
MNCRCSRDDYPHTRKREIFLGTVTPPFLLPQCGGVPMTHQQPDSTMIEYVKITELHAHPRNARQGDVGAIITSIEKNGWYGTIVVQRGTNYILAGNHRYLAAQQLGMTHLPVYWIECDEDRALAILLADNRLSDLASYDNDALLDILSDVQAAGMLLETGYDEDDLRKMIEPPTLPEDKPTKEIQCPECGAKFNAKG